MAKLPAFRRRGPEVDGALAMALKSMRANPGEDRVQSGMSDHHNASDHHHQDFTVLPPLSYFNDPFPALTASTAPVLIPLPFNHKYGVLAPGAIKL